jgi:glycosyltransferase involved in cell wall biosynthesis
MIRLGAQVDFFFADDVIRRSRGIADKIVFPWIVGFTRSLRAYDVVDSNNAGYLLSMARNGPVTVARSHGLEVMAHLERIKTVRAEGRRLSWKYPLYYGGYRLWEERTALRCADLALLLNSRDRDYVIDAMGVAPSKAHIVSNGLTDTFLNLPIDHIETEDSAPSIAVIGTYIERKGIRYMGPALNNVLRRFPEVSVSFVGAGNQADSIPGDFDSEFHSRVHVMPRFKQQELPGILRKHSIHLFPSLSEGFGLALLEAMSCGLAPIVTSIPGPTEFARDGFNAVLIPPRDSDAIETALTRLIVDSDLRKMLRLNAYRTAQEFGWRRIAQNTLSLYAEALLRRERVNAERVKTDA